MIHSKQINCFYILLLISNNLISQKWNICIYDNDLQFKGHYSKPLDSISYSDNNFFNFDEKLYFSNFEGCYIRFFPSYPDDDIDKKIDSLFFKRDLSNQFELNVASSKYSYKQFEEFYLIGEPFPELSLNSGFSSEIIIPDGRWIKLDRYKNKVYDFEINDFKLNGFIYLYYPLSNKVKRISHYTKGFFSKININLFKNGEVRYIDYENFDSDKTQPLYILNDSNGLKRHIIYPKQFDIIYEKGKIIKYYTIDNDFFNGKYFIKNENGSIIEEGKYRHGRRKGIIRYYNDNGELDKIEYYLLGIKLWSKKN